jgi:hypothetical protein
MESISDLYGFEVEEIEEARQLVENVLGVRLDAHGSLYRGGEYYRKKFGEGKLILQPNADLLWQEGDPLEERYAETDFTNYPILLYLEGHTAPDAVRDKLTTSIRQIRFLRRQQG